MNLDNLTADVREKVRDYNDCEAVPHTYDCDWVLVDKDAADAAITALLDEERRSRGKAHQLATMLNEEMSLRLKAEAEVERLQAELAGWAGMDIAIRNMMTDISKLSSEVERWKSVAHMVANEPLTEHELINDEGAATVKRALARYDAEVKP